MTNTGNLDYFRLVTITIPIKRGLKERKRGRDKKRNRTVTITIPIKRGLKDNPHAPHSTTDIRYNYYPIKRGLKAQSIDRSLFSIL